MHVTSILVPVVRVWFVFDVKGHLERRVFSLLLSLLLSLFNCEKFHSLRTYRTSESNIEENCMLDKSKSIVQGTKSTRNRVFTTELN